jgi:hypothetical protein
MIPLSTSLSRTYFIANVNSVWRESQGTVQESILSIVPGPIKLWRALWCGITCNPNWNAIEDIDRDTYLGIDLGIHLDTNLDTLQITEDTLQITEDTLQITEDMLQIKEDHSRTHRITSDQLLRKLAASIILDDHGMCSQQSN